jgi:hypothetical protein
MGSTDKKPKLLRKDERKPKKVLPKPADDDEEEDGDIATPKRDRNDEDDQPV